MLVAFVSGSELLVFAAADAACHPLLRFFGREGNETRDRVSGSVALKAVVQAVRPVVVVRIEPGSAMQALSRRVVLPPGPSLVFIRDAVRLTLVARAHQPPPRRRLGDRSRPGLPAGVDVVQVGVDAPVGSIVSTGSQQPLGSRERAVELGYLALGEVQPSRARAPLHSRVFAKRQVWAEAWADQADDQLHPCHSIRSRLWLR